MFKKFLVILLLALSLTGCSAGDLLGGRTGSSVGLEDSMGTSINPATEDSQLSGNQLTRIIDSNTGREVDVQYPLSVSDGNVKANEIWPEQSNMGNFSGVVTDLFDNLHTTVVDSTSSTTKEILIHFEDSTVIYAIGLGAFTGSFSNTEIQFLTSGGVSFTAFDESTDDTDKTTLTQLFPLVAGANAIKLIFHTTDEVTLSNVFVVKAKATISRIQAVSEFNGEVEDVESFRGALNVTDPLVHKLGVNEFFTRETGASTTLAIATTEGDTSITVVDSTGFVVGDKIRITQNGTREVGIIFITNVVANVITLDRPLANNFIIGTNVIEVENNITPVVGTLTSPVSFRITPPAGQIWQITRLLISMTDGSGSMDDDKFGSLPALTNGAVGRAETVGGRTVNITNWKANRDLVSDMYDVTYPTRTPAGTYALRGRWTFTNAQFIVELDGDQGHFLEILVQDDLTDMDNATVKAQGRIFGG